ncbi:TPA: nitrate/nitrite transporter, partial [Salmonella enterica subsp. enterica serovar Waycross]
YKKLYSHMNTWFLFMDRRRFMKTSNFQKWLMVILLAIGGGTIFKSMYLREVFYYPWNEFMGVNNTDSGLLMSWLGFVGIVSSSIAGVIIDKVNNTRLIISFTFLAVGVTTLWQSTAPGLATQYVIIGILSFLANGLFLVSMVRAPRLIGNASDQGKLFGFLESGRGIAGSAISAVAVAWFAMSATEVEGIGSVLHAYGFLYLALGVLMWFAMPRDNHNSASGEKKAKEKISVHDILAVMKVKEVWFAAFSIFATISFYQGSSYLVPYLSDVYGMTAEHAGIIGMIRAYVLAILIAPVVGLLADKVGSAIKVMNWLFIAGVIGVAMFLVIPQDPTMVWVLIGTLMIVGSINFALRGIMYAQIEEMKVPVRLTGTVMGIMATVGFSPEMFIHALFGYWLDAYKVQGYTYMFIFMGAMFALAVFTSLLLLRNAKTAFKKMDGEPANTFRTAAE